LPAEHEDSNTGTQRLILIVFGGGSGYQTRLNVTFVRILCAFLSFLSAVLCGREH